MSDFFSGYLEAFAIPDKSANTIAKILIDKVLTKHFWPRELVSDNGTEFCNEIMSAITKQGHIHHIRTSPFHPRSNGKTERAHKTLKSCLSKVCKTDMKTEWDTHLAHICSAYNASVSAGTKFSPFYLVFHRDPVFPVDTILKPREKYYGDEYLPKALEIMHRSYHLVRKRLKEQSKRNKEYFDSRNNVQNVQFDVGDPVYLKNRHRTNALDDQWSSHYRVIKRNGRFNYVVQHQLTGKIKRAHAKDLNLANLDGQWEVPQARTKRATRYVNLNDESDSEMSLDSEDESVNGETESDDDSGEPTIDTDSQTNVDTNNCSSEVNVTPGSVNSL